MTLRELSKWWRITRVILIVILANFFLILLSGVLKEPQFYQIEAYILVFEILVVNLIALFGGMYWIIQFFDCVQ